MCLAMEWETPGNGTYGGGSAAGAGDRAEMLLAVVKDVDYHGLILSDDWQHRSPMDAATLS